MQSSVVEFESLGDRVKGFLTCPDVPGKTPAVIIIHSIVGMTDHIRDVAARLAKDHYVGLAVDLYSREGGGPDPLDKPARARFFENLPDPRVMTDLDRAVDFLRAHSRVDHDRIGVLGFCMGGGYTVLFATHSRLLRAAVCYYGKVVYPELNEKKPISPIENAKNLSCPLLFHFGDQDEFIPHKHPLLLEKEMARFGKTFSIKIHRGARHDFFNETLESYNEAAARQSWQQTLEFFEHHLRLSKLNDNAQQGRP
jgi:carboxymethylenebutenolidase